MVPHKVQNVFNYLEHMNSTHSTHKLYMFSGTVTPTATCTYNVSKAQLKCTINFGAAYTVNECTSHFDKNVITCYMYDRSQNKAFTLCKPLKHHNEVYLRTRNFERVVARS